MVTMVRHRLERQISADEMAVTDEELNQAAIMYLGTDGTGITMRAAETVDHKGKPNAGDPKPHAKTREMKLATICSAKRFDDRGSDSDFGIIFIVKIP